MIRIHRREQWDLNRRGDVKPILCAHRSTPGKSRRLFVLWRDGRLLKAMGRGWGVHVLPMLSRPSWHRYTFHERRRDGFRDVEVGTLVLGFAQVKWTRTLPVVPSAALA